MAKAQKDFLVQLINSLSKSEKRNFRLFVNRNNPKGDKLFMSLFEVLDKKGSFDEHLILKKIPNIKKTQLSNLKAHLYKQILVSLRLNEKNNFPDIAIREQLDYAKILHAKGHYTASLDILNKAKKQAVDIQHFPLLLSIINFERRIESFHVTGSTFLKAEEIEKESNEIVNKIYNNNRLSNLSLTMYGHHLKYGFAKDAKDRAFIKDYFHSKLEGLDTGKMYFYEKMYWFQSHIWYYHMVVDLQNYYKYSQRLLQLFNEHPKIKYRESSLYLKAINNILNSLFLLERPDKFLPIYQELLGFIDDNKFQLKKDTIDQWHFFKHIHSLNRCFLLGQYSELAGSFSELEQLLESNELHWDNNRLLMLNYKIACVYFGNDDWGKSIHFLNQINWQVHSNFREDLQCFARILSLIAHYELGNLQLLKYQIKSTYRFIAKMNDLQQVQIEIFQFLKQIPSMKAENLSFEFKKIHKKLIQLEKNPFERRPFLYLDIISWLESKIQKETIQTILKRKIAFRMKHK